MIRFLKTLLLSATIAGLSVSCVDNTLETEYFSPTAFIGLTTTTTRASSVDLSVMKNDATGFRVFATGGNAPSGWYIDDEANPIDGTNHHRFQSGKWGFHIPVKWSKAGADYPMKFYAYYPATSVGFQQFNEQFTPNISLTAFYNVQDVGGQEDLMAATITASTRPASGTVGLVFRHILSKINFGIIAGTGTIPHIQSLEVVNAKTQRGFDFIEGDWFTPPAGLASYRYFGKAPSGGGAIPVFTPTDCDGNTANPFPCHCGLDPQPPCVTPHNHLMLMPQIAKSWKPQSGAKPNVDSGGYVCLIYRMNINDVETPCLVGMDDASAHPDWATKGNNYTGPLFVKVGFPLPTDGAGNFTWEKGRGYTYNIVLGIFDSSNGFILDENYYDENGNRTDLPLLEIREEYKLPGDPLNDGKIHFILVVNEWDNDDESEVGMIPEKPPKALFELEGVAINTPVKITFTDQSSRTTTLNHLAQIVADPSDFHLTIESLSINNGAPILIGRKANEPINLKFNNGNLVHRDPVNGAIPIGTSAELQLINTASNALTGSYKQEADINLMNKSWSPIGKNSTTRFTGIYDGNGYVIEGLFVNLSADYAGLFGYVGVANVSTGVFNLGVSGNVTGKQYVGGIAGYIYASRIENCFSAVYVTSVTAGTNAGFSVGGIAGQIYYGSSIVNSYSTGDVTGIQNVGGIVGLLNSNANNNSSVVENCYATGAITGEYLVGGIVGQINQSAFVKNCVALNKWVKGLPSASSQHSVGRVYVRTVGTNNCINNHAWNNMGTDGGEPFLLGIQDAHNGYDGIGIPASTIGSAAYWTTTTGSWTGWNPAVWTIANGKLPGLFDQSVAFPPHL